ncbi:MAG TPA: YdeI/OmpD-associated family protein [Rhodanobacteraceae bacterium]|nr:YdeI/OmpD-associated family protein [Rhodanobacteraceae bacterium]
MGKTPAKSRFKARLLRPAKPGRGAAWSFVVLPTSASDTLPRRGRTSVDGSLNGQPFQATLEPDGQRSHWLKVGEALREAAGAAIGDTVELEIAPVAKEPEPKLPADLRRALSAAPEARRVWDATTTLARVDWIHWVESAKQSATRERRVRNACEMLAAGKRRVCCFDPSGYYDHSLGAPEAAD